MQVRVLFFGMLKDVVGRSADTLSLPEGATLHDLLAHYQAGFPRIKEFVSALAMSVNQEYAPADAALHENDEVALLPPVSGGTADPARTATSLRSQHAEIVRHKIDVQAVSERLRRPADGAVAVFEGIVRDNSRGRRTLFLDYEAYEEMALKKMEALAQQALQNFKIRDAGLVHRLGRLEIGETSVLIVVASGHRAAAFEACRWLIDALKRTVPIWKKEHFEDGAVWADGEPFPAEISSPARAEPGGRASK
jgi:molybdopterin synthase catalytic subunit